MFRRTRSCVLYVVVTAALIAGPLLGQARQPEEALANALVKWDTMCVDRGCLLQTDVLRGESGDPPDPKDFREYIAIDVALERKTQKPAYFAFHVHPKAERGQGIFIAFTKTTPDGNSWKVNLDSDGASKLVLSSCDDKSCVARVPVGLVQEGKDSRNLNLLDKFLNSDHMLLLYVKDGRPYRTMVLLSSFKKEYQRVLATELSPSGTSKK